MLLDMQLPPSLADFQLQAATFLALAAAVPLIIMLFFSKKWNASGKNCFVTGGSQGLGLSVAILLAKKGANVTIVARNVDKLKAALEDIEKHRQNEQQKFKYLSFELNTLKGAEGAVEAACAENDGVVPDAFFLCAGSSTPMFFLETSEEILVKSMEQAYWVQAWSARAASQKLVQQDKKGKISFVGSMVSHMGLIGYSMYAPGKFALKGLAETLRSEFQLYGIDIHIMFAPTMHTPGYDVEQQTKPDILKKIEEDDMVISADKAAAILVKAVENGQYQVGGNLLANIFAASTRGTGPSSSPFSFVLDLVGWIAIPVWRMMTDRQIRKNAAEHRTLLQNKGLIDAK